MPLQFTEGLNPSTNMEAVKAVKKDNTDYENLKKELKQLKKQLKKMEEDNFKMRQELNKYPQENFW